MTSSKATAHWLKLLHFLFCHRCCYLASNSTLKGQRVTNVTHCRCSIKKLSLWIVKIVARDFQNEHYKNKNRNQVGRALADHPASDPETGLKAGGTLGAAAAVSAQPPLDREVEKPLSVGARPGQVWRQHRHCQRNPANANVSFLLTNIFKCSGG